MAEHHAILEQRLKLRVNRQKSAVAPAVEADPSGVSVLPRKRRGRGCTVAPKALKRAKDRLRELTSRNWGVSMERRIKEINRFTVGWTAYFALADTPCRSRSSTNGCAAGCGRCAGRSGSAHKRATGTSARSVSPTDDARAWAASQKGYWRVAGSWPLQRALPNAYWHRPGPEGIHRSLPPFPGMLTRTAGCGPARPVVWEGPG